jgi:serine/threonine protein kinase
MQSAIPIRVQIGAFELHLKAGDLRKGAQRIHLQGQPFQILLMLVERAGELVTREEIKRKLWPNDTVVEFDDSIHTAMKKLRQALGDAADNPKYVETVARRGYRLIVPVECLESTPADKPTGEEDLSSVDGVAARLQLAPAGLTGRTVSHYRVLDVIGGGGMGVVYKAEDLKLGRAVALKFLPEDLGSDPHALERFSREARAASSLDHPNICPIYEFGEHEGRPFMVMQLLEGQTLRDRLADTAGEGALPLEELLEIGIQVSYGLQAAHEKGIIHRDIKPANIFVTDKGVCKILDFGLVKLLEADQEDGGAEAQDEPSNTVSRGKSASITLTLTRTGMAMGTAGYMSPEQVRGERLDARTDLFSFGLILYEMTTGLRAFSGDTAAILKDAILNHTPRPVRELNPTAPPMLEQVINKALEKDRLQRYQHASEMQDDLDRLNPRNKPRRSGVRQGLIVGAVTALLLAGVGLWRVKRQPSVAREMSELKQTQLTSNTSDDPVRDNAISPDGKILAYTDAKGIHLKFIATGDIQTLAKPEALKGMHVDWSVGPWFHDGTRLMFSANVAGQLPSTWTFPLIGGAARKLRDDVGISDISPDGSLLVFTANPGKIGDREIWLMDSNGEHVRKLCDGDENTEYPDLHWSPDGQRLAYFRFHQTPAKWEEFLESRDLQGGPPTTILSSGPWWQKGGLRDFLWLPGGRVIYILGDNYLNGFSCNYWEIFVDEHTGKPRSQPRQLTNWAGFCMQNLNATANYKQIAYVRFSSQRSVEVADLDASGTRISNQKRLTTSEGNEYPMAWTADSKAVIFHSNRNGSMEIFKQALDQDTPEAIVVGTEDSAPAASVVSPDGLSLIYTLLPKAQGGESAPPSRIMRVPITGGLPQLLLTTPLSGPPRCARSPASLCAIAERTPDHKQLIFSALDPINGRGRELTRLVIDPGENYSWDLSPDGTRIAVAKQPGRQFDVLFLNGRAAQQIVVKGWDIGISGRIANARGEGVDFAWAADGSGLFTPSRTAERFVLLHVDLHGNALVVREQNGGLNPTMAAGFFGHWGLPSPDGRHLAMLGWSRNSNVWIMEGL